jgi:alpha-tubulin suppressor-like RCC1 family protein
MGDVRFTVISAGTSHTCGLTATGAAYCWGFDMFGALGQGEHAERTSPVRVIGF